MKMKHWWILVSTLILLILLASIPRLYSAESVAVDQMDTYPVLKSAYEDLCNQYSLHEITTEDTIHVVTIKNLWGSWERYILPCYTIYLPDIPTAGSVRCSASLQLLAPWSEEDAFTDLFQLKVRDFSLYTEPGENLFISSAYAELTHANLSPAHQLVPPKLIEFSDAVICNQLPTIAVEYSIATLDSTMDREQPVNTTLTWEYSIRFMGKRIRTGSYRLSHDHVANA